jgi:hypothetical protein
MKLNGIYNKVAARVKTSVKEENLIDYIKEIETTGRYNNLTVRVVNDIKNILFSPKEVCSWYDEYNCNDNHVTTLFKKVVRENYPNAWKIMEGGK